MKITISAIKSILLFSLLFLVCCSKDEPTEDIQKPELLLIEPMAQGIPLEYQAESTFRLIVQCRDNVGLSGLTISIMPTDGGTNVFQPLFKPLNGREQLDTLSIQIPSAVRSGLYDVKVYCADLRQQTSDTVNLKIDISNPNDPTLPQINITEPLENTTFFKGNSAKLKGNIVSKTDLKVIEYRLSTWIADSLDFLPDGTTMMDFEKNILIPSDIEPGDYILKITAVTKNLLYSEKKININVK